ncbi:MAG TPA: mechanosensitive ion channel domain-containing protein [Gemmatimonadaceae bacterium]
MTTPDWMYRSFFGNSLLDWTVAAGSALAVSAGILLLRWLVVHRLPAFAARTDTLVDDALIELARSVRRTFVVVVALCLAGFWLDFSPHVHFLLRTAAIVVAVLQGARSGTRLVSWWLEHYSARHGDLDRTTITALGIAAKIVVWVTLLLIGAENLGFEIKGLLTGLGIGGIALALALQNIFADLFAALSIVLDKPFVVGDTIAVDDFEGSVEHIGLKSTRVASINGEQVVFANTDLLKSRVRNLSRRQGRRLLFTVSIDPATKSELLAQVPQIMADVVGAEPRAALRRCHLVGAGVRGFDVETAILIPHPEYNQALDVRQAILLEFYSRLEHEGISLARPPGLLAARNDPA